MRFVMCVMAMLAAATAASARTMPIYNGVLVNDLDAGGHSITNIAAPVNPSDMATKAYVDSTSGMTPSSVTNIASQVVTNDVASWALKPNEKPQGMSTNAVKAIINAEVGGTNTIVHSLAPATNYTDAASNNLATAIAEKRGLRDLSVYAKGFGSWYASSPTDATFTNINIYFGETAWHISYSATKGEESYSENNILWDGTRSDVIIDIGTRSVGHVIFERPVIHIATETNIAITAATSGLAKLGADGVLTAAAAADVPGLSSKVGQADVDATIVASNLLTKAEASTTYLGISAQASDSAKLNGETKAQVISGLIDAETSRSIAESVVGDNTEYILTNITSNTETFSLESGMIGNLELDSLHTNINFTLQISIPFKSTRSMDAIVRVVNSADSVLRISHVGNTDIDGTGWEIVKAGTNYITVTRTALDSAGRTKLLIGVKEIK